MAGNLTQTANWDAMRSQMPVSRQWVYLDHAAVAPLSNRARDAVLQWSTQAAETGDVSWPIWADQVEQIRQLVAATIHAEPEEIALVPNTTAGIGLVAEGMPWQSGDNLVTLANEFPSNQYPWMNLKSRGVETRRVELPDGRADPELILSHCDGRTRLISVSWVGYANGWRIDLAALVERAHQRGILVFLDAIQGLGVFPLDVVATPVDFLAADGHKWMLGPEGAGICFVRREHLDLLRPLGVGWNSVQRSYDFGHIDLNLRPTARRYEGGSMNMVGLLALGASLQMLVDAGLAFDRSAVADRVLSVTDYACERLAGAGARVLSHRTGERRSGIVTFDLPHVDLAQFRQTCLHEHVVLSCRGGGLRISPHAYNNAEDIDRLIELVAKVMP